MLKSLLSCQHLNQPCERARQLDCAVRLRPHQLSPLQPHDELGAEQCWYINTPKDLLLLSPSQTHNAIQRVDDDNLVLSRLSFKMHKKRTLQVV